MELYSEFRLEGDLKMQHEIATKKGFKSPKDYLLHLLRQGPLYCPFMHAEYAKTCTSEKIKEKNGEKRCDFYKNVMLSGCKAFHGDGGSLLCPDDSHLTVSKDVQEEEMARILATARGLTKKELLHYLEIQEVHRCMLKADVLMKCIDREGYKPCAKHESSFRRLFPKEQQAGRE